MKIEFKNSISSDNFHEDVFKLIVTHIKTPKENYIKYEISGAQICKVGSFPYPEVLDRIIFLIDREVIKELEKK